MRGIEVYVKKAFPKDSPPPKPYYKIELRWIYGQKTRWHEMGWARTSERAIKRARAMEASYCTVRVLVCLKGQTLWEIPLTPSGGESEATDPL